MVEINAKYRRVRIGGLDMDSENSRTKQSFKDECNINMIMERAKKTGVVRGPLGTGVGTPRFGDFSNTLDYKSSLNRIIQANQAFESLPAKIRKRFDNSPQKLIEFMENEGNRDEAIRLGIIEGLKKDEPVVPEPEKQPVAEDSAA